MCTILSEWTLLDATIEEFAADGYTQVEANCPRCRIIRLRPIDQLPRISRSSDWPQRRPLVCAFVATASAAFPQVCLDIAVIFSAIGPTILQAYLLGISLVATAFRQAGD